MIPAFPEKGGSTFIFLYAFQVNSSGPEPIKVFLPKVIANYTDHPDLGIIAGGKGTV
jgi:hypothetical protein